MSILNWPAKLRHLTTLEALQSYCLLIMIAELHVLHVILNYDKNHLQNINEICLASTMGFALICVWN